VATQSVKVFLVGAMLKHSMQKLNQ